MSETRICPVCENEIPEYARFLCPHCHFELKWLDDSEATQDARQNFTGELFTVEKFPEKGRESNPAKDHRKAGILGAFIAPIIYFVIWPSSEVGWQLFCLPLNILFCLPLGLLVGYLGLSIEEKLKKPMNSRFVFLMLTFILSSILCVFFLVIVEDNSVNPY